MKIYLKNRKNLIKTLVDRKITPILVIPPLFIDVLDDESLNRLIYLKNKFYSIIECEVNNLKVSLKVYDFFKVFKDKMMDWKYNHAKHNQKF